MVRKEKRIVTAEAEEKGEAVDGVDEAMQQSAKKRKKQGATEGVKAPDVENDVQEEENEEDEDEDDDDDDDEEIVEEADGEECDEDGEGEKQQVRIFRPGVDEVLEGEQLDVEPGTYNLLHKAQVEWPCLSFDIVRDELGAQRTSYPMTSYIVAGTQASNAADNRIYMMKWSRLYKTLKDGKEDSDDEDDSEDEDDDDEHEAVLDSKGVPHPGGVNRIRSMPQAPHIVATWADTGKVHMWNFESHRRALDKPGEKVQGNVKPIFTNDAHKTEGFAMDFNPNETGQFLSGDNDGVVLLWNTAPGGWKVCSDTPFRGHKGSVEDVQWKRHGNGAKFLFASCSSDKSFRVWDIREANREKSVVHVTKAHTSDVNVLSWSPCVGELLVTGSDDGGFKIWDTRNTGDGPMANFVWHQKPVTSVDWHPTDETVLAVASEDDSVSIWDMAVEDDAEGKDAPPGAEHYPAQLLFLHQGLQDPKEVKWHPQLPGVCISTAASGFNIFKPCNM
eukprot:TRINITY_DN48947_c0_g1_i1.p1 TRINITY_DN48947_c0_g1~~TRINITY_DN48947_c0_g1_i1.p1  ORF type:complete len:503 (-),score=114.81 TRINITY_DN48947_c0_g1_i1:66-1574(-)